MSFALTPLPYDKGALEPHISARTVELHYEKHHRGYVDKLNKVLDGDEDLDRDLVHLITSLPPGEAFNCAAQIWNHDFYWKSVGPNGGAPPEGEFAQRIKQDFGSLDRLKRQLAEAAGNEFGSGWAWLTVSAAGKLEVSSTTDAQNPLQGVRDPLLTIDVWEHAYYLDFQNDRGKYIEACLEHLVQWDFAAQNFMRWHEASRAAGEVP